MALPELNKSKSRVVNVMTPRNTIRITSNNSTDLKPNLGLSLHTLY